MMGLIKVEVKSSLRIESWSTIDRYAFIDCGCVGTHEYSVEEEEIDRVLGDHAFCGGELDEKYYDLIEEKMEKECGRSFFWMEEKRTGLSKFKMYLEEANIDFELSHVPIEDWNEDWRKSFSRIEISKTLKVIPSWEKEGSQTHNIYIYPGMGFGTGNHETTFLCLKVYESIESRLEEGHSCLDFGCGSGILGLAPMKRKSAHVDFVDIDEEALDNCVMNLEINEHLKYEGEKSVILRDRFKPQKKYQLVFANILENVLEVEGGLLQNLGEKGSYLIVSGLLNNQVDNIISKYEKLEVINVESKADWSAVLFRY